MDSTFPSPYITMYLTMVFYGLYFFYTHIGIYSDTSHPLYVDILLLKREAKYFKVPSYFTGPKHPIKPSVYPLFFLLLILWLKLPLVLQFSHIIHLCVAQVKVLVYFRGTKIKLFKLTYYDLSTMWYMMR